MRTQQAAETLDHDTYAVVRPSPLRRAIAWVTLVAYVGQPLAVTAEIIADQTAAPNNRPLVDVTANGLPLVQIAPPSAAGVSHNQYNQFNVGPEGVILNNGTGPSLTQQAGYVGANPNLVNGSARIILNEVTSTSRSQLNGYTEVAGQQAEVIIANPNGITCNGCGFINASRGVLTTGTPVMGVGGSLDYFRVTGGDIQIGSGGLNGSNTSQLDLITRSVQVNGELWANNLNVITGSNQVNYNTLGVQVIQGTGAQPTVGIDVALLGGMYANKIRLIGTEAGVGVNSLGNLSAQAGDFTLDNAGQITLAGSTTAGGNIAISSATGIANSGTLYSQQNATLTSTTGTITNSGNNAKLLSQGNLTLNAASVNSTGALGAGIDTTGNATQSGNIVITTSGQTTATGTNIAGGSMSISATSINLANSQTSTGNGIDLNATAGNIDNSNGTLISMLGTTRLNASGNILNGGGTIASGQDLSVTANTISGNGNILAGNDATIGLQGNYTNAVGNTIKANNNLTIGTTGVFTNQSLLEAAGNLTLNSTGLDNQTNAQINSYHTTLNIGTGNITNAGRIEGNLFDTTSNNFTNTGTVLGGMVALKANNLNNIGANALIGATSTLNLIITNALVNQTDVLESQVVNGQRPAVARIFSLGDINIGSNVAIDPATGYLMGNAVSVTNSSATIEAWGNLRIGADTITNKRTVIGVEWGPESVGTPTTVGIEHYTPSVSVEQFTAATTVSGQMLANGNIRLGGTAITNEYSDIIAGGTITTLGGQLNNIGNPFQERTSYVNATQDNWVTVVVGWHWGVCGSRLAPYPCRINDTATVNQPITITKSPKYLNATGNNFTKLEGGAPSIGGTPTGSGPVQSSNIGNGNTAITVPNGGLYTVQPQPNQNYLVATDPRFTSYANFISSDYMLSRMALDPQTTQKRLGDGFYEQQLVMDQITSLTGRRFLGQYTDTNEQYIALLESGVDAAEEFNIVPGVALTPEQINSLKHDIVWLVDQAVKLPDGSTQHVLAPKVYLSKLHQADLRPTGALIAADVIDIKIAEQKQPEQVIPVADARYRVMPAISIEEPIYTAMPALHPGYSDAPVARIAMPDESVPMLRHPTEMGEPELALHNTIMPALLPERDNGDGRVTIMPVTPGDYGKKIISKPIAPQPLADGSLTNSGNIRANRYLSIDAKDITNRGGNISSNGSLYLNASNDIRNQSGNISGRNVSLNAGRDIVSERISEVINGTFGSAGALTTGFGKFAAAQPQGSYTSTTVYGTAGITATEGLDITAGRDITLAASNINAGGNATINAGRDLNVRTVTDVQSSSNGLGSSVSNTKQLTSSITTGGNLTLVSGDDMHLTSVKMEVGKEATLIAGGDLTLDASKNSSTLNVDTALYKARSLDETVIGSSLNAGGNINLIATRMNTAQEGESTPSAETGASATEGGDAPVKGNITLNSATIASKTGNVAIMADANVNIGITEERHESFTELNTESKGSGFTTIHRTTRNETWRTDTVGSSITGDNIKIASNKDITIEGSTVEAERNIDVAAMGNLNIVAATDTYGSESYSRERTTGLQIEHAFSITDQGPDITQRSRTEGSKQSQNRSSLVSKNGDLNLMAGGDLFVVGSDLAAGPQPEAVPERPHWGEEEGMAYIQMEPVNASRGNDGISKSEFLNGGKGRERQGGQINLTAGGSIALLAGQDFESTSSEVLIVTNPNAFTKIRRTITDTSTDLTHQGSTVQGRGIKLSSGADILLQATDVQAGDKGIEIDAGQDLKLLAAVDQHSRTHQEKLATDGYTFRADGSLNDTDTRRMNNKFESQTSVNQVTRLTSKGDIKTHSGRDTLIEASTLEAQGTIDLSAGTEATYNEDGTIKTEAVKGNITFAAVKDSNYYSVEDSQNSMPWQSSTGHGEMKETIKLANIKAGKGLSVDASGEIIVDIPEVPAEAPAPVEPEVVEVEEPMPTHGADGKPLSQEELDAIAAERAAKAAAKAAEKAEKAAKAAEEKRQRDEQRFNDHITTLAGKSGQEWIGQLAKMAKDKPDSVKLRQVNAALQKWDYAHEGLTGEASAVIAIVVTYFTAGAGSSIVTSTAGSAAAASATGTVVAAVIQAAVTNLATQATLGLINNKGNVGKTLDDMGKSENVKSLVTAMITAGVLAGIGQNIKIGSGDTAKTLNSINAKSDFMDVLQKNVINNTASTIVNHAMYGGDLQQQLEQSLKNALIDTGAAKAANWIGDKKQDETFNKVTHKLAHAIAGCAAGAAKSNDCSSGALGAVVGEITAELYGDNGGKPLTDDQRNNTLFLSKLMAGVAAALTGGDVNVAAAAGENAVANNFLGHDEVAQHRKEVADCKGNRQCLVAVDDKYRAISRKNDREAYDAVMDEDAGVMPAYLLKQEQEQLAAMLNGPSLCGADPACRAEVNRNIDQIQGIIDAPHDRELLKGIALGFGSLLLPGVGIEALFGRGAVEAAGVFDVGANITPMSTANTYRTIGANGTFVTPISSIETITGSISPAATEIAISKTQAVALENALGLVPGSLESSNMLSIVSNVTTRAPRSPLIGNDFFLGAGRGLPSGWTELVIDSIPSAGGQGIRQITVKVR